MPQEESLDELANKFFDMFMRFEYALKATGHLKKSKNDNAEANWDHYANSNLIKKLFQEPEPDLKQAINYIAQNPPKKQVIVDNKLAWALTKPQGPVSSLLLITYVRRIRNNIFHGGKRIAHGWADVERSRQLITSSIIILTHCLRASPELQDEF